MQQCSTMCSWAIFALRLSALSQPLRKSVPHVKNWRLRSAVNKFVSLCCLCVFIVLSGIVHKKGISFSCLCVRPCLAGMAGAVMEFMIW